MYNVKLLSRILNAMASDIMGKGCGLDDDEMEKAVASIDSSECGIGRDELKMAVEKFEQMPMEKKVKIISKFVDQKLYIEQICQRYGISRATLNRWQQKGKLPNFRHESGGKDYLFREECDESLRLWNLQHEDE